LGATESLRLHGWQTDSVRGNRLGLGQTEGRHYTTEVIRSNRRTLALEVRAPGIVTVRIPRRTSQRAVAQLLDAHANWIARALYRTEQRLAGATPSLADDERSRLRELAAEELPELVASWAPAVGVKPSRIQIRQQRTRWGSCSARGTISLNAQLMLLEPELRDYVIVHELCHLAHHNHGPHFWATVERVLPDYRTRRARLKEAVIR